MHEKVRKGKLVLKDGSVFEGTLYGGKRNAVGEVVFTTGMSGYQETLTDPSFCGQIVVMTYPLVGNYGCNPLFNQGKKCFFQGFVIGELCDCPSNWRNEQSLEDFLIEQDIPTLAGVDTRAITRKIRNHGVLQGVIVPAEMPEEEVQKLLALPAVHNQVEQVTTPEVYTMGEGKLHVAVMDFGIKRNILKSIEAFGGGDEPEDGLEALAFAMRSKWNTEGTRRRQVIVVWSDAATHPLGFGAAADNYPSKMAKDFSELTAWWGDKQNQPYMNYSAKRLVLYTPNQPGWSTIVENWDGVIHYPSEAGAGLKEADYQQILNTIVHTV